MATTTWSGPVMHDTDANFRLWGKAISDNLALLSAKLTKTADTGQIDWATVTRASASGLAGYEIYYLNDAMHSTQPLYFRIEYRTGSSANFPHMRVLVGTSTDGAGNLSGPFATTNFFASIGVAGTTTSVPSYACATEGAFWFTLWRGASARGLFFCSRTCDTDGTPDGRGVYVISHGENSGTSNNRTNGLSYRFSSPAGLANSELVADSYYSSFYGPSLTAAESVDESGNYPAYLMYVQLPSLNPLNTVCAVYEEHITLGGTFAATLVGTTSHTYIRPSDYSQDANFCNGVLWPAYIWE